MNDNNINVDCDAESFGGGWTKISSLTQTVQQTGDVDVARIPTPPWYLFDDIGNCNQYMWVDEGTQLDFAVNSGSWHSDGFDLEKHVFVTSTDGYFKVRDRG